MTRSKPGGTAETVPFYCVQKYKCLFDYTKSTWNNPRHECKAR